ncbi:M56 family metallopeptidase [Aliikangiella sp. IMCC44359]|uniref:M56 family metallopeptidase n=1 Tax=Aliikangiella sp. IMCC44359 TaxID=3459125 RepID=UPI00403B1ABD
MLTELTLFTTIAIHHMLIGFFLLTLLLILNSVIKFNPEVRSWLWLTAFVLATITPLSLLVQTNEPTSTALVQDKKVNSISPKKVSQALVTETDKEKYLANQWHLPSHWVKSVKPLLYVFLIVWFIGSCWRSIHLIRAFLKTKQVLLSSKPIKKLKLDSQLHKINLLKSAIISTPMVVGWLRPVIIIPNRFVQQFKESSLIPIVLHEQAHIERNDPLIGFLQEVFAIIFWWSPVMRLINHKIHINRELACDLRAIAKLNNNKQYAQVLIDCAKLMLFQKSYGLTMGLFSHKKDLTYRINEVLNMKTNKKPKKLAMIATCFSLAYATVSLSQNYLPQIDVDSIKLDSNHFSELSESESELLSDVIEQNDYQTLELMISHGLDINKPIIGDGTALIIAVKAGNIEMVNKLISMGANVNQSADNDGNPLIAASINNNLEIAKILLANKANIDAIVINDETALINASKYGHFNMVKFLVENGADINLGVNAQTLSGIEYRTPINVASTTQIKNYLKNKITQ